MPGTIAWREVEVNSADWVGSAGVGMLLVAFVLNLTRTVTVRSIAYRMLNLVGASLACLASVLIDYFPFVVLEGRMGSGGIGRRDRTALPGARALGLTGLQRWCGRGEETSVRGGLEGLWRGCPDPPWLPST